MMSYAEYEKILEARRGKSGDDADDAEEDVEVEETQLTTEGMKDFAFGFQGRGRHDEETEKEFAKRQWPGISWSHDSRWFALIRRDRREVGELWVVHAVGNKRPQLETYKYDMPGEENVSQSSLWVFDMESRDVREIVADPWKDQRMGVFSDPAGGFGEPDEIRVVKWLSNRPDELYYWRRSRDQRRVDVVRANPATGETVGVIEERLNTYVEHQTPRRLENGDLIWWSERDGWAHLYRHGPDGAVRARLTEGPWHVDAVTGLSEEGGYVVFRANGREDGEDPYYMHTYRVGFDGTGLELLNPGNFDHRSQVSESARYFVDNYSRVDAAPASALRDARGRKIMDLEQAEPLSNCGRRDISSRSRTRSSRPTA